MIKLIAFILMLSTNAYSQTPTIVFGESELPNHQKDSILVVQPEGAPNPLGNPIVTNPQNEQTETQNTNQNANPATRSSPINKINQDSEQNPPPFSSTTQQLENKIENTLYQGGNRIYDIQSYPIKDIKEITEPNIQPTISDYPSY